MFQIGIWQNFEVPNRMLIRQAVSPIRKAVVADCHNPIAVITLSPTLVSALILIIIAAIYKKGSIYFLTRVFLLLYSD